eukprot:CAMPEP_0201662086 /NCGR_PEP_ID=MMETSP0494-20130426/4283_1 /ASSEMBLY_ACC=CAM_ASM_000839 /TAXON_ID=420259 /ORGANISM="Thalassiosira gravida, Strain GMp14c1" /LENGTH=766 /DNA_ID=CAMNT_0048140373 /DNA_START=189 /DNA_END=2489 /DNA_ORIENTATION=+
MPRDRAYSNASSSGYGSEDHPSSSNTPRRNRNTRQGTGRGGGYGGGGHNGHNGNNGNNGNYGHNNGHNGNNNHNNGHGHGHGHGGGHRYHEMTLLCHRVDLFDDFVPRKSGDNSSSRGAAEEGLVPIRCLTSDGGCACDTPCAFCHTVVEDRDNESDRDHPDVIESAAGGVDGDALLPPPPPVDIHPNLAFLFAEKAEIGKKLPTLPCAKHDTKEGCATATATTTTTTTKSTVTSTLVVDQIFAQNHGLLSDHVEGGVKVKKYHHPPVARYGFTPPLMELPKFFDDVAVPIRNGRAECYAPNNNGHDESKSVARESKSVAQEPKESAQEPKESNSNESKEEEEDSSELDSFFDDFAVAPKPPPKPPPKKPQAKPKKRTDNDRQVLVFRAPLKTVVKKTITSSSVDDDGNDDDSRGCLCQSRYENLMKGSSTQTNPHDPSVVHDKYWAQRRRLFKKFDDGIRLDAEGWYSVTPEVVADHVASRFADASARLVRSYNNHEARGGGGGGGGRGNNSRGGGGQTSQRTKQPPPKSMVILDAFCGCGGNAIAFAKLPPSSISLIVCIEIDRTKLRKAAHNASIYGIPPDRILFVEANSVAVMQRCYRDGKLIMDPPPRNHLSRYPPREVYRDFTIGGIDLLPEYAPRIDAVFMDPPWGGIDYGATGKDGYDLSRDMTIRGCERGCVGFPPTPEVDGVCLLKIAAAATGTRFVAYDLPRNANKRSLAHAALEAGYEGNSKLEEHYLNGRLKTVTAYFGMDFRHLLDLKKYHR